MGTNANIVPGVAAWLQQNPNASDSDIKRWMDTNTVDVWQVAAATGIPVDEVTRRYSAASYTPSVVDQSGAWGAGFATPVYTPPTVNPANSAADIARMYAQYTQAAGGDTAANRDAAINYLRQSGVSDAVMGQAYQQYLGGRYAEGGEVDAPRYLEGVSNGQSDELAATIEGSEPARLSHGEFVVPADIVAALGGGNSKSGAQTLYDMMDRIREQAYGHKQQMRPVDPNKTLPA